MKEKKNKTGYLQWSSWADPPLENLFSLQDLEKWGSLLAVILGQPSGSIIQTYGSVFCSVVSLASTTLFTGHKVTAGKSISQTGWSVESKVVIVGW